MKLKERILFENDDLIALDKPAGLLTIPDREGKDISLKQILREVYGNIFTIHRLDKETSGLILFAKNETAHKYYSRQFEERLTEKIYCGLLVGCPSEKKGTINAPIREHPLKKGSMVINRKGKESLTDYEVQEDFSIFSWVQFRIHTGRTHQVRIHAKHIGHPVVCDPLYGDGNPIMLSAIKHRYRLSKNEWEEKPILNRLGLHAASLGFVTMQGDPVSITAPLPKDLKALLQQLRKIKG